jgi:hypothetical protein
MIRDSSTGQIRPTILSQSIALRLSRAPNRGSDTRRARRALRTDAHVRRARTASKTAKGRRRYARWGMSLTPFESVTDSDGFRAVPAGLACRKRSRHSGRTILSPGARATTRGKAAQMAMPLTQQKCDTFHTHVTLILSERHR